MPIKSDELDSLFNKIILKLCTSTKNITNHPMPLEFLREEIQLSICISTALELKIIFNRLVQFSFQAEDYNILIEVDGNYWHGKGLEWEKLNQTQKLSRTNDNKKSSICLEKQQILIRFWEDEIDENLVISIIQKYEKNKHNME